MRHEDPTHRPDRSAALRRRALLTVLLVPAFALTACGDNAFKGTVSETTALVRYDACEDLEADLKDMLHGELESRYEQAEARRRRFSWGDALAGSARDDAAMEASAPADADGGREEGVDFSGTNNQEAGVDEADLVKTDGYHLYVLNGNRLHTYGIPEFGDLDPLSELELEGHPTQLLIRGDRAVVFATVHAHALPEGHPMREHLLRDREEDGRRWWWRSNAAVKVTVLDLTDRTAPEAVREIYMEGWYQTARRIDDAVLMGVYGLIDVPIHWWFHGTRQEMREQLEAGKARIDDLTLVDLIPQIYERDGTDGYVAHSLSQQACSSFHRPTHSSGRGIASIMSLDLFGDALDLQAEHIVSNYPTFYASQERIYVAEATRDWWWFWFNGDHPDQTNVHAFDITAPGETAYLGSGRVKGRVLNQFSLSEYDGHLRLATTERRDAFWWETGALPTENHVFVVSLDADSAGNLETVGHVGGLAEGERIFSARFVGEKGYVVTFVDIDPLFTIDLSDPTDPKVMAELKIPGFSTYIHPIEDDRLLTMGVGGDDFGANWRAQVSMFDVSDFEDPKLQDVHELITEGEWGWSEAMYEHKAFTYWAPRKLLAVPVSSYDHGRDAHGNYWWRYHSRLEVISVDTATGLSSYGSIDHSDLYNRDEDRYWYYRDVRRSIFMGDYIYSVSDAGVMVHTIEDLSPVTSDALPGWTPYHYHWWW